MTGTQCQSEREVYTIGHSNHDLDRFVGLLKQHGIRLVIDTRSSPFSRFSPQFNREVLCAKLPALNVDYGFLGQTLGGRPKSSEFYDADGRALYWRIAQTAEFSQAIDEIIAQAS